MADYHPIDVRYKGPSTAYRGSAKRNDTVKPRRDTPPQKAPATRQAASPSSPTPAQPNPWGPVQQTPAQPPRPTPAPAPPHSRPRTLGSVFRNLRRAYTAFVILIILMVVFGGPSGLLNLFSLSSGQMISLP